MRPTISKLTMKIALIIAASFHPHWRRQQGDDWGREIVEGESGARGFSVPPHRR
jgi:hypothetical protein